jgi:hypothetical protein
MSPEQQERPEDELSTGYLNEKIDVYALGESPLLESTILIDVI